MRDKIFNNERHCLNWPMAYLLGKNAKTMARLANKKLQAPSQLLEKEGKTMTKKVQTNNGRIVIHDPAWQQGGAIVTHQPQPITIPASVPNHDPLPSWQPGYPQPQQPQRKSLANLIAAGWQRFGRTRGHWVEQVRHNAHDYSYNQYTTWSVCAVAAAYLIAYPKESPMSIRHIDSHIASVALAPVLGYNIKEAKVPSIRQNNYGQIGWLEAELIAMNDDGWPSHLIIEYAQAAERHILGSAK